MDEIRAGTISANKASNVYGIPKGTVINKLHRGEDTKGKPGPDTVLTEEEEDLIAKWILDMAKVGYPLHPEDVKDTVKDIVVKLERKNTFTDNRPGDKWMKLFLGRHSEIVKKNAEILSIARSDVTEGKIRSWLKGLYEYLLEEKCEDI